MDGEHSLFAISGKAGVLDRKGNEIIPGVYDDIRSIDIKDLYRVTVNSKHGLYFIGKFAIKI